MAASKIRQTLTYVFALAIAALFAKILVDGGLKIGIILIMVPPSIIFLIFSFRQPGLLLLVSVIMAFAIAGLSRYVPGIPFGLTIDFFLILVIVILIFDGKVKFQKEYLLNPLSLALLGWVLFSFVEIVNPLAKSLTAWFYANRGLSFYPVLYAMLSMYVLKRKKDIDIFLLIWIIMSTLGTLWGMKQLMLGVSDVEQRWLNAGAASTHVLFGKLRVFSYYSDAAQFGASQAHTALVFGIIGLFSGKMKYRFVYLGLSLFALYGMLISGTRGALAILAIGGFGYFVMTKNFRIVISGLVLGLGLFVFLKYTTIGQSNYQINRLRTSLDPKDPSLVVRKEREKVLEGYMIDKPLGGGIGSAGYWGKRFSPGTFLAELGTDGHYTRIWMETGIIGLWLYRMMLIVIVFYLGRMLWVMEDSLLRQKLVAFYCSLLGIMVASYTNGLLTQIPTGTLIFVGLALIYKGTRGDLK